MVSQFIGQRVCGVGRVFGTSVYLLLLIYVQACQLSLFELVANRGCTTVTLIASKYKKTLHGRLKAVKKKCQDTGAAQGSRQYYFCKGQLQERTYKAANQTSERPSTSKCPNVLTGNVFAESRTYSHEWSVSFVKIIVIAKGTIKEVGTDGEMGNR